MGAAEDHFRRAHFSAAKGRLTALYSRPSCPPGLRFPVLSLARPFPTPDLRDPERRADRHRRRTWRLSSILPNVAEIEQILRDFRLIVGAGLLSQAIAVLLRLPEMVVLVAMGALIGPSVLKLVENPLDGIETQLVFTIGVSLILFHGGTGISLLVLSRTAMGLSLLALPGVFDGGRGSFGSSSRLRGAPPARPHDRRGPRRYRPDHPDIALRRHPPEARSPRLLSPSQALDSL